MEPFGIYTSRLRDLEERCVSGVPLWGRRRRRESCSFPVQCRRIRRLCLEAPPRVLWASVGLAGDRLSGRPYRLSAFQAVWVLATSPTTFDFAIISLILSVSPLVSGVSDAGSVASYGARMSSVHPDSPTSTIRPPTRSPTRRKYPPLRGTTVTLLPSTSKIPIQAENIRVPTLNELSPSRWSPSARSSPGATTCLGSATITKVFSL